MKVLNNLNFISEELRNMKKEKEKGCFNYQEKKVYLDLVEKIAKEHYGKITKEATPAAEILMYVKMLRDGNEE